MRWLSFSCRSSCNNQIEASHNPPRENGISSSFWPKSDLNAALVLKLLTPLWQLMNEKCNGQPLDALLIRPIQRIPSLLLLYKGLKLGPGPNCYTVLDLYKELSQIDSVHSFDIKEVVEQLEELLTKLNHEKGLDEGRQRLLEMATAIEHFPQDIVSSQRIGKSPKSADFLLSWLLLHVSIRPNGPKLPFHDKLQFTASNTVLSHWKNDYPNWNGRIPWRL